MSLKKPCCFKELLLLLDNGDQLPELADFVREILRVAPQVKILVAAQQRLGLREECVYEIGALTYPTHKSDADKFQYSALQLTRVPTRAKLANITSL